MLPVKELDLNGWLLLMIIAKVDTGQGNGVAVGIGPGSVEGQDAARLAKPPLRRLTTPLVQDSIVDPVLAVYVQIALGDDKVGIAAHGAVRAVAVPHLRERVTR
jgi:hypothetical protein